MQTEAIILQEGKKKYVYDYPDQRELCVGLRYGDYTHIASLTGYHAVTVQQMGRGTRKMNDTVSGVIAKFLKMRAEFEKAVNEPETETVVSEQ